MCGLLQTKFLQTAMMRLLSNIMHSTNYRPSRSQQLFLSALVKQRHLQEQIVVHHVLEDTSVKLHLQIERRHPTLGISFERVML